MKNIHIIPTPNPSRLHKTVDKGLFYLKTNYNSSSRWFNQKIYITSDEEIKRIDYWLNIDNNTISNGEMFELANDAPSCKKIILTNDQDLINDGVQPIKDEFLEWFVKNPSCEEVETFIDTMGCTLENCNANPCVNYKIIIPKEEPKKEYQTCKCGSNWFNTTVVDKPFCFKCGESVKKDFKPTEENCTCTDECLGYLTKTCKGIKEEPKQELRKVCKCKRAYINPLSGICSLCWNEKFPDEKDDIKEEDLLKPKQETLEETALRLYPNRESFLDRFQDIEREAFIKGYKLAQERSYSEEEVLPLLEIIQKCKEYFLLKTDKYSDERADAIIDVIEQFKKK